MAQNTHANFIAQIQTCAIILQDIHHTQTLLVMMEGLTDTLRKRAFAGMAEGRMTQVMAQGNSLSQIFIQRQGPGDGSCDPGNLNGVGHAGAVMVTLRPQKHLGFVHQPAKRLAVNNSVRIPLIAGAHIHFFHDIAHRAALALVSKSSQGIQTAMLL